ncbi:hypothetical protein AB1J05_01560 [Staphylococcus cohnii species complex 1658]|uniref:hypothetical protein n=1 Tax=Staphylococcus cohnii species complex 1658 TaxID=3239424 RepID=UPI0034D96BCD
MAYEYEEVIKEEMPFSGISQELQEVYRKARAFDEISNLIESNNVDYGENNLEDVEEIVNKYWEDE